MKTASLSLSLFSQTPGQNSRAYWGRDPYRLPHPRNLQKLPEACSAPNSRLLFPSSACPDWTLSRPRPWGRRPGAARALFTRLPEPGPASFVIHGAGAQPGLSFGESEWSPKTWVFFPCADPGPVWGWGRVIWPGSTRSFRPERATHGAMVEMWGGGDSGRRGLPTSLLFSLHLPDPRSASRAAPW